MFMVMITEAQETRLLRYLVFIFLQEPDIFNEVLSDIPRVNNFAINKLGISNITVMWNNMDITLWFSSTQIHEIIATWFVKILIEGFTSLSKTHLDCTRKDGGVFNVNLTWYVLGNDGNIMALF